MRVLLIADENESAQSIEPMLIDESINLHTAHLGQEGVDLGKLFADSAAGVIFTDEPMVPIAL